MAQGQSAAQKGRQTGRHCWQPFECVIFPSALLHFTWDDPVEEVSPPSLLRGLPISGASRFLLAVTGQSPAACRCPANRARLVGAGPRCALSLELACCTTHCARVQSQLMRTFCVYQLLCNNDPRKQLFVSFEMQVAVNHARINDDWWLFLSATCMSSNSQKLTAALKSWSANKVGLVPWELG